MKAWRYTSVLVIVLVMMIFTIAEGTRTIKIGYNIAEMEEELKGLLEENKSLEYKLSQSKTLETISQKVEELQLDLEITDTNDYIILVNEPYENRKRKSYGKVGT
ncbi:MAG: hypothetical protein GY941_17425 [Planctomycetes bacterium]|nr:hypothetical protein [Planctomycetota bacterium]